MERILITAIAASLAWAVNAQTPAELLTDMRRRNQEHASVYLQRNTTFRIERQGDGAVAFREVEERRLILKDFAGKTAEEQVYYSGMIPLKKLDAFTMTPHKKGYKRVSVSLVEHRDERDDNIFHDDSKVASFVLPALTSGAITHVAHTIHYPDARMVGGHFFTGPHPTEESTLTVISDPGIDVDIRTFHLPDSLVKVTRTTERGRVVQRFTTRALPPMMFEDNAPRMRHYTPHAQLVVRLPGEDPALSDVERLHRWYRQHVEATDKGLTEELQALADSLTMGLDRERDKAVAIHRWVQQHIRYVAFEDGMRGLIPEPAEQVCRLRYGDCKGMSNLLRTLLHAAGLQAHLAWVGTRSLPYTFGELPSNSSNDHMIVALDLPDTTYYLDPTASWNAFGVPSGFTQGKEVLITLGAERSRVDMIPPPAAHTNGIVDTVQLRLVGNDITGTGVAHITGYDKYGIARRLSHYPKSKHRDVLRPVLMKGSNKFLLDSCRVEGMDDPASPLVIHYSFRLPDHGHRSGDKLYLPLVLSNPWEDLRPRSGRRLPVQVPYHQTRQYSATLELPDGAQLVDIPADASQSARDFGYTLRTVSNDRSVTSGATFILDTLMVDEELGPWKEITQGLSKVLGHTIVIQMPAP